MNRKSLIFPLLIIIACLALPGEESQFKGYWYKGKAELTRYQLKQARYGEMHDGDAVLIFVTEPFLQDKEVKYESGDSSNAISVLKLNFVRKFYTGIYPYSVMTSVFTPVDYQHHRTLKVTMSSQEWCGQVFTQMNFRKDQYDALIRSYFQKEGDQNFTVKTPWLEDELWTRIRLAPDTLPKGEIQIVPGLQFVRLWHQELQPETATATRTMEGSLNVYTIDYKNIKRKLVIRFEQKFPYAIVSWDETQPGAFGDSPLLTTKAVKTNSILLDYWNKHSEADADYRKQLGLTQ